MNAIKNRNTKSLRQKDWPQLKNSFDLNARTLEQKSVDDDAFDEIKGTKTGGFSKNGNF